MRSSRTSGNGSSQIGFDRRVGSGERLFGETSDKKPMRLVHAQTVGEGLAYLTYELVRDA